MSLPRPHVPTPPLPLVAQALMTIGLPTPKAIAPLAPPWAHANYRVDFRPETGVPSLLLRRVLHAPLRDSLQAEWAALSLVQHSEHLPVARDYRILPPGLLPWPAALSTFLPGKQGMRLIKEDPARAPEVTQVVGRLMARLASVPAEPFGTVPVGGRFLPRRPTWRGEWEAWAWGALARARSAAVDLGPLTDEVARRLADRLGALDEVGAFALVHGDLHPSNLLFADDGTVTGLVDWEGAYVGDPLAEWAVPLELPEETLGHVVAGYGPERVRAWLDDRGALARLEVYALTRCLTRLAWVAGELFDSDGGRRRAFALEYARVVHKEVLVPGFAAQKLRRALELGTDRPVVSQVPTARPDRLLWRALEATHRAAPADAHGAMTLAAAFAAGLLARRTTPELGLRWLDLGEAACDQLGPQRRRTWAEPIAQRRQWGAELVGTALRARSAFPATVLWLAFVSLRELHPDEWPVGDPVLRGLEGTVRLLVAADGLSPVVGERAALAHALLRSAAAHGLAALGADPEPAHAALQHAWEDLALFGSGVVTPGPREPAPAQAWLARRPPLEGADLLVPSLRLALDTAALPAQRAVFWATLGLDRAPAAPP